MIRKFFICVFLIFIMKLRPTLKENKRYLLLVAKIKKFSRDSFEKRIEKTLIDYLGILGYGKAGPIFVETAYKNGVAYSIVSVNNKFVVDVKASLVLSKSGLRCTYVSGTIKKLKKKLENSLTKPF